MGADGMGENLQGRRTDTGEKTEKTGDSVTRHVLDLCAMDILAVALDLMGFGLTLTHHAHARGRLALLWPLAYKI